MNLRHRAAGLVLSCDSDQIEHQLELLDKAAAIGEVFYPPEEVKVWSKYENESLNNLLEIIENHEDELKEVWNAALDLAAGVVDADLEPMGWLAEKHMEEPLKAGEDYEIGIHRSSILEHKKQ